MFPTQQGVLNSEHWEKFHTESLTTVPKRSKGQTALEHVDAVQVEALKQKIFEEAFQQGYQKAKEDVLNEQQQAHLVAEQQQQALQHAQNALLQTLTSKVGEKTLHISASIQKECADIIRKMVTEIVKTELSVSPEKLGAAITDALTLLVGDQEITLFLAPADHEIIASVLSDNHLTTTKDSSLEPGDFYLTQGYSTLDGRLDTRIEQAVSSIFGNK